MTSVSKRNPEYQRIRLERIKVRKAKRREIRKEANKGKRCPYCGRSSYDDDCWY